MIGFKILAFTLVLFVFSADGFAETPIRPLVFIPGILGSTLVDSVGKVVWGDWRSLSHLEVLTIADGPTQPADGIKASGPIQNVMRIGPWAVKQYSSLSEYLESLGYRRGLNYFEFAYDWRQSNFRTAEQFADFVQQNKILQEQGFDLLAHSMGGLVAQIYVKTMDQNHLVRKVVNMGVPFMGSVNTLAMLTEGWGGIGSFFSTDLSSIRKFSLSLPSFYELLPLYPNCCIEGSPRGERQPYNPLIPEKWRLVTWIPEPLNIATRLRVDEALIKARKLRDLTFSPYPDHNQVYFIVGGGIDTYWQYYIDPTEGKLVKYNYAEGDGTVAEGSASAGRPDKAFVSLAKHSTIFDDDYVRKTLRRILVANNPFPENYNSRVYAAVALDGSVIPIQSIRFNVYPSLLRVGDECNLEFSVTGDVGASLDKLNYEIFLESDLKPRIVSHSSSLDSSSPLAWQATYRTKVKVGEVPGIQTYVLKIKGLPHMEDYLVVVEEER